MEPILHLKQGNMIIQMTWTSKAQIIIMYLLQISIILTIQNNIQYHMLILMRFQQRIINVKILYLIIFHRQKIILNQRTQLNQIQASVNMLFKNINKEANIKDTKKTEWDMVLVFFIIKMAGCTKVNGDSIKCKVKVSCFINLENWPMKEIGQMINFRDKDLFTMKILKS
jgi:hypothetical protein